MRTLESTRMQITFRRLARPLTLLALLAIYAVAIWLAFVCESDWTARQTWAVILTGAAVIWYTWETRELRQATYAQMDLQIRPYVVLQPDGRSSLVTNFGSGVALHVHIEPVVVDTKERIELRFPKTVPVLRSGESVSPEITCYKEGKPTSDIYKDLLNPKNATEEYEVKLCFDNLELKPYTRTQRVSPNSIVVSA